MSGSGARSAFPLGIRERTRTFSPLGIRFWDAAFDVPIDRPLEVHAWLRPGPFPPARALRSAGGVYAFHGLPGQGATEYPRGHRHPEDLGPELEYTIVVDDPSGQFLPAAFTITLPLGYRGEFLAGSTASVPAGGGRAYLFSAPSRPVPPGAAAIRADLEDGDSAAPAAWAVVRATVEGQAATGVADERGRILVLAPPPPVHRLGLGSPPGSGQGPLSGSAWPVTLRVEYDPDALRYPMAGGVEVPASWAARPSLKSILDEQDPGLVTLVEGDAAVSEWTEDLTYGEPLLLRTRDAGGTLLSTVRIHAGASIP